MTIFSLLVLFVGTFAWFESHLKRENNANNFAVSDLDGKLKNVYFHQANSVVIDNNTEKPISFTFEEDYCGKISYDWETNTADYDGDTSITLEEYDPFEHTHPVLMVFELNDAYSSRLAGDIVIKASTDVEGYLGERDANSAPVAWIFGIKFNNFQGI